jgi:hypothetical protein
MDGSCLNGRLPNLERRSSGLEWSIPSLDGNVSCLEWSISGWRWSVPGLESGGSRQKNIQLSYLQTNFIRRFHRLTQIF